MQLRLIILALEFFLFPGGKKFFFEEGFLAPAILGEIIEPHLRELSLPFRIGKLERRRIGTDFEKRLARLNVRSCIRINPFHNAGDFRLDRDFILRFDRADRQRFLDDGPFLYFDLCETRIGGFFRIAEEEITGNSYPYDKHADNDEFLFHGDPWRNGRSAAATIAVNGTDSL